MATLEAERPDHCAVLAYDYALINPLQVEQATWGDLPVVSVVPWQFGGQPHLFPLLLELGKLDRAVRLGLLDRMEAWEKDNDSPWFSALWKSPASALHLRDHLARHMVRRVSSRVDLLRPYDPRVFRHLSGWLLTPEQAGQLLGPIEVWAWREPDGAWFRHERHGETPQPELGARLAESQWASYGRLGVINSILAGLARDAPEVRSEAALWQRLDGLLAEATAVQRLDDDEDRRLYAEQAVRFHPRIHRHPELLRRLTLARSGEVSYTGACADLDDEALRALAIDCTKKDKEHEFAN